MAEKTFVNGMIFKLPTTKMPEFVKGKISVKVDEFIEFAKQHQDNGWLNIDMCESRAGKGYCALNTWKPTVANEASSQQYQNESAPADSGAPFDDSIPFLQKDRFMVI